ncbi:MAG: ABC transporter substrate-binding protein [Syntrophaceticus sp.]|nr:ABC transporter substrate-binding protein [Syntrophaceticus sp.]MDD3315614.1 ABC transporter substrate-binding protein [Syntrophaceticus sp.]MDD4360537.1 ABC transporter substrate-binding protein [Syntrophaceticus sp.]MDD4783690.1 ABC transporter substrate-binding protein [Syntrophaceticus sp.]
MKKKLLKPLLCMLAMVLILTLLTSCSNDRSSSGTDKNVIVDQLGRTVEYPDKVEKVSAGHIYAGKMLFAMGQKEKIAYQLQIGADTEALAKVDEFYGSLPTVLSAPNGVDSPEGLLALGVDVVFTDAGKGEEEAAVFQNAGIPAIAVSGETFDEVYETARIMGEVLDCPERTQEVIDFIEDLRNMVSSRVKDISDDEKPVVMVCGSGGVYTAATADMFQHQMVETAGGINAGANLNGKWANVSAEDIILWDPDYIVLGSSFGVDDVESVLTDPALQTVTAIKNKDVYIFPSTLGWWDFPLPQSVLGIIWTAKTIHPDQFTDINMLEMADSVYEFIYGYTYSELGGVL